MREAGCTAVQEVAFTLANGLTYVEAAVKAGLAVDDFAPQLAFFFCSQPDMFEEVAKFRAARRLWARLMQEPSAPRTPRACSCASTPRPPAPASPPSSPTTTWSARPIEALAAVLGGTQSLHTNAKDEALSLPTEASALLALRTQQVLAYESGATNTVDPLAGSYYVEALTDRIEAEASAPMATSTSWAACYRQSRTGSRSPRSSARPTGSPTRSTPGSGSSSG